MLPTQSASRSCSRDLLRTIAHSSARPFCGGTTNLARQRRRNHTRRPAGTCSSRPVACNGGYGGRTGQWQARRLASSDPSPQPDRKDEIYTLIDRIDENDAEIEKSLDELDLLDDHGHIVEGPDYEETFSYVIGHRNQHSLEAKVQRVRQEFGDNIPDGYLSQPELELYTQLYGEPTHVEESVEGEEMEGDEVEEEPDKLYRQDNEGEWEEVDYEPAGSQEEQDDIPVAYDMEAEPVEDETATMRRAREVAKELEGELKLEEAQRQANPQRTDRQHSMTVKGRVQPGSISLPKKTMVEPIAAILSDYPNKHIYHKAHELFGGPGLPHSTTTPPPSAQLPQHPIPLTATQRHMSEMEGNAFVSVLYPGIYATALSILAEVRKRMGTDWIRGLMEKENGPNVLDVGGGGAGMLAWRDILRAEWESMDPARSKGKSPPSGKSTVITGSDAMQVRASVMLENTSFLPRLPDYVHVRDKPTLDDERDPPTRKQYDLIIAPHNLLGVEEEFMRKERVENLWSLLNPEGGVLILFEKGRQKGFEAIAGAREMLLNRYIASGGSTQYETATEALNQDRFVTKETGMIIAPCTNHGACPMYRVPGPVKGRTDYCHFEQRYHRPDFLQRIKGSKDRNFEDVEFSYVAVQRGVDLRQQNIVAQGPEATDAAFEGYEHIRDTPLRQITAPESAESQATATEEPELKPAVEPHTLSLPRIVYPPLKRKGHVILDVCTPGAEIERWIVPRSYSRQAYKDARKSWWGDLWALGAKTRVPRNLRVGSKDGEGKKESLARRAAKKAALQAGVDPESFDPDEHEPEGKSLDMSDPNNPNKQKGQTIPRWKKKSSKRARKQALKDEDARAARSIPE